MAEDILRTDGWIVGAMKCGGSGKRCAVGAIRAACGIREHGNSGSRLKKEAYALALHALATAINPHYKGSKAMKPFIRDEVDVAWGDPLPKFDTLTKASQIEALEQYIIDFNDGRAENDQGRRTILRRFAKAARLYAQS